MDKHASAALAAIQAALAAESAHYNEAAPTEVSPHTKLDCHWKFRVSKKALEDLGWTRKGEAGWTAGDSVFDLMRRYDAPKEVEQA